MARPQITDDQKEIAIELLANALRKDAHLRNRARGVAEGGSPWLAGTSRRADSAQRYVEGMRDMLRVLFPNGHAVADACMDAAYARAMGIPRGGDGGGPHHH